MSDFLTVDVIGETLTILGALGFLFLGVQAVQILRK